MRQHRIPFILLSKVRSMLNEKCICCHRLRASLQLIPPVSTLTGTPSTGYSWNLCANSTTAVDLVNHKETDVPPDNWTFDFIVTSKTTGVYQIIAGYSKPWLHGAPEQTSTVNVHLVY